MSRKNQKKLLSHVLLIASYTSGSFSIAAYRYRSNQENNNKVGTTHTIGNWTHRHSQMPDSLLLSGWGILFLCIF